MNLLNQALHDRNFGLRYKFPWTSQTLNSSHIQTHIRWNERRFLEELFEDVFYEDDELDIERIENPYLWGQYVLKYEEMRARSESQYVREEIMIHATSSRSAYKIAEENFNWRLVERARFGKGVSFTYDADYAVQHARKSSVFIVAGVLIANSNPGDWDETLPDGKNDTTTGYTEDVCIKYYDSDYYPYYIVW